MVFCFPAYWRLCSLVSSEFLFTRGTEQMVKSSRIKNVRSKIVSSWWNCKMRRYARLLSISLPYFPKIHEMDTSCITILISWLLQTLNTLFCLKRRNCWRTSIHTVSVGRLVCNLAFQMDLFLKPFMSKTKTKMQTLKKRPFKYVGEVNCKLSFFLEYTKLNKTGRIALVQSFLFRES